MIGLKEYYWCFEEVLPENLCNDIVKYGNSKTLKKGLVGDFGEYSADSKIRKSQICFLDDRWILDEIIPYVRIGNQNAGWNFDFDWCESIQFTNYEPGEFYGWHSDDMTSPYNEKHHPNYRGKIRKLSATVNLTDPSEYMGGDFELDLRNNPQGRNIINIDQVKPKGSIVIFPSFVTHQVTPVRKGKRTSLVLWNLGPPWK
jgi:PKHD-type hydroxylase|tara:strand:- start:3319 stop:3921 length:603 start_codon:yes stop_codon:yes gene_type:complete